MIVLVGAVWSAFDALHVKFVQKLIFMMSLSAEFVCGYGAHHRQAQDCASSNTTPTLQGVHSSQHWQKGLGEHGDTSAAQDHNKGTTRVGERFFCVKSSRKTSTCCPLRCTRPKLESYSASVFRSSSLLPRRGAVCAGDKSSNT